MWNVILSVFAPRTVSTFRPKGDVDNYVEMATLPLRIIPQFTLARGTGQLRSAHLERAACCHLGARFYQFVCAFGFQPTNDLQTQAVARMLMCCAGTDARRRASCQQHGENCRPSGTAAEPEPTPLSLLTPECLFRIPAFG